MKNAFLARILLIIALFAASSMRANAAPTTSGFDTLSTEIPFAVKGDEVMDVTPQGLVIPTAKGPLNATSLTTLINLLNTNCAVGAYLTKTGPTTFACTPVAGGTQTATNTNNTNTTTNTVNTASDTTASATANGSSYASATATSSSSSSNVSSTSSASATSCAATPTVCAAYVAGTGSLPDTYTAQTAQANYNSYIASGMTSAQATAQVTTDARNTTRVATRH